MASSWNGYSVYISASSTATSITASLHFVTASGWNISIGTRTATLWGESKSGGGYSGAGKDWTVITVTKTGLTPNTDYTFSGSFPVKATITGYGYIGTLDVSKTVRTQDDYMRGFNLNILLPDGSEPYSTGTAGSVEFSSNGGNTYSRIYNEPASSYKKDTSFKLRNFTPGTGMHLSETTGVTGDLSGPWSATQPNDGLTINFKTAWNTFTIRYNANGGSGAPGDQTKTYGVDLSLSSTQPTRAGYKFLGWGLTNNATSITYNAGATMNTEPAVTHATVVTLYAIWKCLGPKVNVSGTWKPTAAYVNVNGTWKPAVAYVNVNGTWHTMT